MGLRPHCEEASHARRGFTAQENTAYPGPPSSPHNSPAHPPAVNFTGFLTGNFTDLPVSFFLSFSHPSLSFFCYCISDGFNRHKFVCTVALTQIFVCQILIKLITSVIYLVVPVIYLSSENSNRFI